MIHFAVLIMPSARAEAPARVLATDPASLESKAMKEIAKAIARPDAEVVLATLELQAKLIETLAAHPWACMAPLPDLVSFELEDAAAEATGGLYVAAPVSGGTGLWRWDQQRFGLVRLSTKTDAIGTLFGRVVSVGGSEGPLGSLSDHLLEHPNECLPPLTPEEQSALAALRAEGGADLYVRLEIGKLSGLWFWEPAKNRLVRITAG